jgi:hypothetical protein
VRGIITYDREKANRLKRYVAIMREYKARVPVEKIISKYGVSRTNLYRYARLAGISRKDRDAMKRKRDAILADYVAVPRIPIRTIALKHRVSVARVSAIASEEGVSRNPPIKKRT